MAFEDLSQYNVLVIEEVSWLSTPKYNCWFLSIMKSRLVPGLVNGCYEDTIALQEFRGRLIFYVIFQVSSIPLREF